MLWSGLYNNTLITINSIRVKQILKKNRVGDNTVEVAMIKAKYTIIATIISSIIGLAGAFFGFWGSTYSSEVKNYIECYMLEMNAKKIIKNYYNTNDINLKSIKWGDLSSSGSNKEFIASFDIGKNKILDVFSTREIPERLLHQTSDIGSSYYANTVQINDRNYLIVWSKSGSGSYFNGEIYRYDGNGKPVSCFSFPTLYSGQIFIKNNKDVYVSGARKYYKLANTDEGFFLIQITDELPPTPGYNILKITRKDGQFVAFYNNEELNLNNEENSFSPITIRAGETIIIDDRYETESRKDSLAIRYQMNQTTVTKFVNDFFTSVLALSPGKTSLLLLDPKTTIPIHVVSMDKYIPRNHSNQELPAGVPIIPNGRIIFPETKSFSMPEVPETR